jgi:hypothetical protein
MMRVCASDLHQGAKHLHEQWLHSTAATVMPMLSGCPATGFSCLLPVIMHPDQVDRSRTCMQRPLCVELLGRGPGCLPFTRCASQSR